MAHQAGSLLDRWTWSARAWFTRSADGFTSLLVEKYGPEFFVDWKPAEQERYAVLREAEESRGASRPRGWVLASCALAGLVIILALAVQPWNTPAGDDTSELLLTLDDQLLDSLPKLAAPPVDPAAKTPIVPRHDPEKPPTKANRGDDLRPVSPSNTPLLRPRPQQKRKQVGLPEPSKRENFPAKPLQKRQNTPPRPKIGLVFHEEPTESLDERVVKLGKEGRRLFEERNYDEAANRFQEIIKLGRATAATHNNLGCCLFRRTNSDTSSAIRQFSMAIKLAPTCPTVYKNRAWTFSEAQVRSRDRRKDFRKNAELNIKIKTGEIAKPTGNFIDLKDSRVPRRIASPRVRLQQL